MIDESTLAQFTTLSAKAFPKVEMLDVTLRDGGFINNFGWDEQFILHHVASLLRGGFESIELGYLGGVSREEGWYEGLASDVPIELVERAAALNSSVRLHCIVNPWRMRGIDDLGKYKTSGLDTLRVAYNQKHAEKVWGVVEQSQRAGLRTIVNVATVSKLNEGAIAEILSEAMRKKVAGVFFADTCSSMRPDELYRLFQDARQRVGPDFILGLHGHDFNGFGMANGYMSALGGANCIDMSIRGIGRGGGNVRAELWALASIAGGCLKRAEFSGVMSAVAEVERALNLDEASLLPALTAAYNINPESLESIYQTSSIDRQNEIVVEVLRAHS